MEYVCYFKYNGICEYCLIVDIRNFGYFEGFDFLVN